MTLLKAGESFRYDLNSTIEFTSIRCYKCQTPFYIPTLLNTHLRESKDVFWCPNGHEQAYVKSTADVLKEQLNQEKEKTDRLRQSFLNEKQDKEAYIKLYQQKSTVAKGLGTKLKNINRRVTNGVCPCCSRTFKDLAAHMQSKHPDKVVKD